MLKLKIALSFINETGKEGMKMGIIVEKMQEFWDSLDTETVVNRKVLFLELLVCVLAGVLAGMIFSPKKRVMIGCYNGDCMVEETEQDEID